MIANIIHVSKQTNRLETLMKELEVQKISDYKIWEGIVIENIPFLGVARSHKQIINWAKMNGLPEVLILEDDIKYLGAGAFQYFIENKPKNFDLYLGSVFHGNIKADGSVEDFAGLTMYIAKQGFYDTFLALNEMNNIDRELAHKGRYIVCDKMVCSQWGGYSENKKTFVEDYDHYLEGRTLFTG